MEAGEQRTSSCLDVVTRGCGDVELVIRTKPIFGENLQALNDTVSLFVYGAQRRCLDEILILESSPTLVV